MQNSSTYNVSLYDMINFCPPMNMQLYGKNRRN